tara:strand:- start:249 stop:362 length:114 start_codon:yes stop_codon:yes gene_type:complete
VKDATCGGASQQKISIWINKHGHAHGVGININHHIKI